MNKKILAILGVLTLAIVGFLIYYIVQHRNAKTDDTVEEKENKTDKNQGVKGFTAADADTEEVIDNEDASEEDIAQTMINNNSQLPAGSNYGKYILKPVQGSSRPLNTLPEIPDKEYCDKVTCGPRDQSCPEEMRIQDCLAGMDCCMNQYHANDDEERDHARNCWYSCYNTVKSPSGLVKPHAQELCNDTCAYV